MFQKVKTFDYSRIRSDSGENFIVSAHEYFAELDYKWTFQLQLKYWIILLCGCEWNLFTNILIAITNTSDNNINTSSWTNCKNIDITIPIVPVVISSVF